MRTLRRTCWVGLAWAVALAGCRKDDEIKVYRVAKDLPAPQQAERANPHGGMAMPPPGGGDAQSLPPGHPAPAAKTVGKVPDGWQPGGGSSMRKASYRVAGDGENMADVSLIILSGPAGGALGNINRWRSQLGLEPIEAKDLEEQVEMLRTKCGDAMVVDITGNAPGANLATDGRTVAAIVERPGETWFFKMRGNAEVVGKEKQRFLDWVASVEPAEVKSR